MKRTTTLFFLTAAAAVSFSCSESVCKMEGTVENFENLENKEVYFVASRDEVDTVAIVDGKFNYTCPLDDYKVYTVICNVENKPRGKRYTTQVVPDAKKITIALGEESSVTGSPLSDKFTAFNDGVNELRKAGAGYDKYIEYCKEFFRENSKTIAGEKAFQNCVRELSVAEIDEYLAMGSEKMQSNPSIERARKDKVAEEATAVGSQYVNISGVSPDGQNISLSDFVGKSPLTLVDFWASWCGPCMRSMPSMVNLWNTWHKKGLNMLGVAVWDGDNSASRKAMEEKGMVWPIMFVGEDKTATQSYGITGIPHIIIIDADGKIIWRGLPNEEEISKLVADTLK